MGLARISRWGGASRWHEPLSVAQHEPARPQDSRAGRGSDSPRSDEGIAARCFRGPHRLGSYRPAQAPPRRTFSQARAAAAGLCRRALRPAGVGHRRLPPHKAADRLAAASEACHVVGWSREDMRDALGIVCEPLEEDPLPMPGLEPWEPGSPRLAAWMFLHRLLDLQATVVLHESAGRDHARPFRRPPRCARQSRQLGGVGNHDGESVDRHHPERVGRFRQKADAGAARGGNAPGLKERRQWKRTNSLAQPMTFPPTNPASRRSGDGADCVACGQPPADGVFNLAALRPAYPIKRQRARREHRHPTASKPGEAPALGALENTIRPKHSLAGAESMQSPEGALISPSRSFGIAVRIPQPRSVAIRPRTAAA